MTNHPNRSMAARELKNRTVLSAAYRLSEESGIPLEDCKHSCSLAYQPDLTADEIIQRVANFGMVSAK